MSTAVTERPSRKSVLADTKGLRSDIKKVEAQTHQAYRNIEVALQHIANASLGLIPVVGLDGISVERCQQRLKSLHEHLEFLRAVLPVVSAAAARASGFSSIEDLAKRQATEFFRETQPDVFKQDLIAEHVGDFMRVCGEAE